MQTIWDLHLKTNCRCGDKKSQGQQLVEHLCVVCGVCVCVCEGGCFDSGGTGYRRKGEQEVKL